jgi:APA family basic amino acid/polyamine antiporter
METELHKKYGIFTAITMVVGIVIGSGIFFKTEAVLTVAGGNAFIGIGALLIVGVVMMICAYTFSLLAGKYGKTNAVVDYSEAMCGEKYAYYVGYFLATIYYPSLTAVLAWVSARYTCILFGIADPLTSGACLALSCFYLIVIFGFNILSPIVAGRFQISTTVIKLIPLVLMAVVGTFVGMTQGNLAANFSTAMPTATGGSGSALFTACVAMAFSYEGWIIVTSIHSELRDASRNMPRALIFGCLIVIVVYVFYYLGINGSITTESLLASGSIQAFINLFGSTGGSLLMVFIVISCLGTTNGLMLGCARGMYAVAMLRRGPRPETFAHVDPTTDMPTNSGILGLVLSGIWLLYFFGGPLSGWFGPFQFDVSELSIITIYAGYIPIFIMMMKKEDQLSPVKRFVMPILSIACCIFMVSAAFIGHPSDVLYYLIVFAVIMAIGVYLSKKKEF